MEDNLLNNPLLHSMDPDKLNFITDFAKKEKPRQMKEAMPFLLMNMNLAKKKNLKFTNPEIQLIAEILTKDLSPAEKSKVNQIMSIMLK